MITIKQRDNLWRINLENEEWEVKDIETLKELIEKIAKLKEEYGKVKKYE